MSQTHGLAEVGPTGRRIQLQLEPLEPRLLLDGSVHVTVIGSDVFIRGDGNDNELNISQVNGSLVITGVNSTTVNGGAPLNIPGPVRNLGISMLGGNDAVTIDDIGLTGGLWFHGGEGVNDLQVFDSGFRGGFTFFGGDDVDGAMVRDTRIGGNVSMDLGAGLSAAELAGTGVGGNIAVQASDDLFFSWLFSGARGNVTALGGTGGLWGTLDGSRAGGSLALNATGLTDCILSDTVARGSISVGSSTDMLDVLLSDVRTGGSFNLSGVLDSIVLAERVAARGNFNVMMHPTSVTPAGLSMADSQFGGALTYMGSGGLDVVGIEDTLARGGVNINTFADSATVLLDGVTTRGDLTVHSATGALTDYDFLELSVSGNANIRGGTDQTDLLLDEFSVGGFLFVGTGSDVDVLVVQNGVVGGRTAITTDAGDDVVFVHNSLFERNFALLTGAGEDTVAIAVGGDSAGPVTQFDGSFALRTEGDDDAVFIGADADAGNTAVFSGVVTLDGGLGTNILDFSPDNVLSQPPSIVNFV